jgi:hypothetical protein
LHLVLNNPANEPIQFVFHFFSQRAGYKVELCFPGRVWRRLVLVPDIPDKAFNVRLHFLHEVRANPGELPGAELLRANQGVLPDGGLIQESARGELYRLNFVAHIFNPVGQSTVTSYA